MSELPCDCCDGCTDRVYLACEYCESIIAASKRLSPAVRELLLSNPEAVAACVEAVRAGRDYSVHKVSNHPDGSKEYLDWCLEEAAIRNSSLSLMDTAIALLPKEG